MKALVEAYRSRRISLGMTQAEAAAAAGVSRKTLTQFENGGSGISLGNLNRLLRAVGLELTAREASARPTLDELSERYGGEEAPVTRRRVRRKRIPS